MIIKNDVPIYNQLVDYIKSGIIDGTFKEESQIPSTTEVSQTLKINPATVLKAFNILVEQDLIYKKRGVGMFVKEGAYQLLFNSKVEEFGKKHIASLIKEAKAIKLNKEELIKILEREWVND